MLTTRTLELAADALEQAIADKAVAGVLDPELATARVEVLLALRHQINNREAVDRDLANTLAAAAAVEARLYAAATEALTGETPR